MKILVEMTQEDIDAGQNKMGLRAMTCPITRAVKRYVPECTSTSTGMICNARGRIGRLPNEANEFMAKADNNYVATTYGYRHPPIELTPITFEVEVFDEEPVNAT